MRPSQTQTYPARPVLAAAALAGLVLLLAGCGPRPAARPAATPPFQGDLNLGLLHSRTGTMAVSEDPVLAGELLAIEEINAAGGLVVDGRRLRLSALVRDGASAPEIFAEEARRLVEEDGVSVVFGGWTSASRKAMLPVFAGSGSLLLYPIQFEGQELADNVFYFGATPNQQSEPAIDWLLAQGHRDFFLVGSDYVYPRTANAIIEAQLLAAGAQVAGTLYLPLEAHFSARHLAVIKASLPAGGVIVNTLNGDSNESFFRRLHEGYLLPQNGYRTVSFSIDEATIAEYGPRYFAGSYISQGFFQSLALAESRSFVRAYGQRFGSHRPVSDTAAMGYTMVRMWALAVAQANDTHADAVSSALRGLTFNSPAGPIVIRANHHVRRNMLLGEVGADGTIAIVAKLGRPEPEPFNRFLPATAL